MRKLRSHEFNSTEIQQWVDGYDDYTNNVNLENILELINAQILAELERDGDLDIDEDEDILNNEYFAQIDARLRSIPVGGDGSRISDWALDIGKRAAINVGENLFQGLVNKIDQSFSLYRLKNKIHDIYNSKRSINLFTGAVESYFNAGLILEAKLIGFKPNTFNYDDSDVLDTVRKARYGQIDLDISPTKETEIVINCLRRNPWNKEVYKTIFEIDGERGLNGVDKFLDIDIDDLKRKITDKEFNKLKHEVSLCNVDLRFIVENDLADLNKKYLGVPKSQIQFVDELEEYSKRINDLEEKINKFDIYAEPIIEAFKIGDKKIWQYADDNNGYAQFLLYEYYLKEIGGNSFQNLYIDSCISKIEKRIKSVNRDIEIDGGESHFAGYLKSYFLYRETLINSANNQR